MKLPWTSGRSEQEHRAAEVRIAQAKAHLRIVLNELNGTVSRIEEKVRRGLPSD